MTLQRGHCDTPSLLVGVFVVLMMAATFHQSFATDAPPTGSPQINNPGRPETGDYTVKHKNGTTCLMARMGLQLNISFNSIAQNKTVLDLVNLQPNITKTNGSCEDPLAASLVLSTDAEKTILTFDFLLNATTNKYHLSGVSLSADWPDMSGHFSANNSNLDYLQGTLGRSYMCHGEQTLDVAQSLSINTFQLQVQPFGLNGDQFGAAEECQLDEDDMLIPIIVGAALAGLVLIVLVAYLIGRKRSHAGYQTI